MRRITKLTYGAALVVGAAMLGGTGALAAPPGYFSQTTAAINLPTTGGTVVKVASVAVLPGNWAIWGKAQIVDFGAHDVGRCVLIVGGAAVDGSGSEIGGGDGFPLVAVLPTQYAFTATVKTTVELGCSHDSDVAGEYVDPSASLMIVRMPTGTIH
jgi:hypothetical protein